MQRVQAGPDGDSAFSEWLGVEIARSALWMVYRQGAPWITEYQVDRHRELIKFFADGSPRAFGRAFHVLTTIGTGRRLEFYRQDPSEVNARRRDCPTYFCTVPSAAILQAFDAPGRDGSELLELVSRELFPTVLRSSERDRESLYPLRSILVLYTRSNLESRFLDSQDASGGGANHGQLLPWFDRVGDSAVVKLKRWHLGGSWQHSVVISPSLKFVNSVTEDGLVVPWAARTLIEASASIDGCDGLIAEFQKAAYVKRHARDVISDYRTVVGDDLDKYMDRHLLDREHFGELVERGNELLRSFDDCIRELEQNRATVTLRHRGVAGLKRDQATRPLNELLWTLAQRRELLQRTLVAQEWRDREVREHLRDMLAARVASTNLRLQTFMKWLTVVATVLGVISLVISLHEG